MDGDDVSADVAIICCSPRSSNVITKQFLFLSQTVALWQQPSQRGSGKRTKVTYGENTKPGGYLHVRFVSIKTDHLYAESLISAFENG